METLNKLHCLNPNEQIFFKEMKRYADKMKLYIYSRERYRSTRSIIRPNLYKELQKLTYELNKYLSNTYNYKNSNINYTNISSSTLLINIMNRVPDIFNIFKIIINTLINTEYCYVDLSFIIDIKGNLYYIDKTLNKILPLSEGMTMKWICEEINNLMKLNQNYINTDDYEPNNNNNREESELPVIIL